MERTSRPRLGALSVVLHGLSLAIGLGGIAIVLHSWLLLGGGPPALSILVAMPVFVLWGLAPVLHPRLAIISFSLLFLFGALLAIETGEVRLGPRALTTRLDDKPVLFVIKVSVLAALAVAAGIWAMRAQITRSDATEDRGRELRRSEGS